MQYAVQIIVTVGGAINMIPSTGVTFPLLSYGGSSILSTLIVFAINSRVGNCGNGAKVHKKKSNRKRSKTCQGKKNAGNPRPR